MAKVTSPQLKRNTLHQCSVCTGYKFDCLSCYLLLVAVLLLVACSSRMNNMKDKKKIGFSCLIFILIEWSKEALIEAWMADPGSACKNAGVTLPDSKSLTSKKKK